MTKKKSLRVKRSELHKVYLLLISKTFRFLHVEYCLKKENFLSYKQNFELYGSLVFECSLTNLKKKDNFLFKLFFSKICNHPVYEKNFIVRELLKLLFLPCFNSMTFYLSLQHHILDNGAIMQNDLRKFFFFVREEFKSYIKKIEQAFGLKNLLNIKDLQHNLKIINQTTREYVRNRKLNNNTYQEIQEIKHKTLVIQLLLLRAMSKAKTKSEIKKYSYCITVFLFKSDELYCGYV